MYSSGNIDCDPSCFRGWVSLVLMCTLLVTEMVACLVSASELAWFFICMLLLTQTMTCLVSDGELAYCLMGTFWWHWLCPVLFQLVSQPALLYALFWCRRLWPVLFQMVSWHGFNVHSSGDTDCCLSCFRWWVGMVSICTLLVTLWPVLSQMVSWLDFSWTPFWWHRSCPFLFQPVS